MRFMNTSIAEIAKDIPKYFESEEGLLSLTIHGSCACDLERKNYVDYDVIFIFKDNMLSDGVDKVKVFFSSLIDKYSNDTHVFIYSMKSGPMHPLRQSESSGLINLKSKNLCFFHVSVFGHSAYIGDNPDASPSKLLLNTWQHQNAIVGQSLRELKSIDCLSIQDVLNSKLGIRDCLKMLEDRKCGYWDFSEAKELIWCYDDFADFDDYEYSIYSIKWCIFNSIIALADYIPFNGKDNSISDLFKKHLLPREKHDSFDYLIGFERDIQFHRQDYTQSPSEFKKKHPTDYMVKATISILAQTDKVLSKIDSFPPRTLFFRYEGKEIPIFLSVSIRAQLQKTISVISPDKILVIYDANVRREYDLSKWLDNIPVVEYIVENSVKEKSLSYLAQLLNFTEESLITASSLIIIVGGGNVGNLGGMSAGLLLRGIPFLHIPTTLVAQLDSAIGAKQSVNGKLGKNRFGLFHNPTEILINPLFNQTLTESHLKSGLIEGLKHGFCQSEKLTKHIINFDIGNVSAIELGHLILQTIQCKLEYMETDPYENSPEQHLELGHKVGHSL